MIYMYSMCDLIGMVIKRFNLRGNLFGVKPVTCTFTASPQFNFFSSPKFMLLQILSSSNLLSFQTEHNSFENLLVSSGTPSCIRQKNLCLGS